jgi:spoIIIJ-associated protein
MLTEKESQKIKEICQKFFAKMETLAKIEIGEEKDKVLPVRVQIEEPSLLIGQNGKTLLEIQILLKAILKKQIFGQKEIFLDLDINDYKKKKEAYLKELAQNIADEVFLSKEEKELPPMPPHERKIIHLEISQRSGVFSQSIGEKEKRRIVVKPKI